MRNERLSLNILPPAGQTYPTVLAGPPPARPEVSQSFWSPGKPSTALGGGTGLALWGQSSLPASLPLTSKNPSLQIGIPDAEGSEHCTRARARRVRV